MKAINFDSTFPSGTRLLIAGGSGSGKTQFIYNLVLEAETCCEIKPKIIHIFYKNI
jgi:uridine kinase